jgi:hypothetical protein
MLYKLLPVVRITFESNFCWIIGAAFGCGAFFV